MEIPELARRIIPLISDKDRKIQGYYLLNINHPVIQALKKRYCTLRKIDPNNTLSDQERIEFELWTLQPRVRKMVEDSTVELENSIKKE